MDDIGSLANLSGAGTLAGVLSTILTATRELLLRTREVHWSIEGPMFFGVHMLTDVQLGDLLAATADLAARLHALGLPVPAGPAGRVEMPATAGKGSPVDAATMLSDLRLRHEALAQACHQGQELAAKAGDPLSADLCAARLSAHEKAAWMLRAMAAG